MNHLEDIVSYLKTDVLKHIVHLKMIEAYAGQIIGHYERHNSQVGIALLIPTLASPFDAQTYPNSDFIVLLAATDPEILQYIILQIPRKTNLVFKFVDAMTRQIILQRFPAQRVTAYLSYTTQEPRFHSHPSVVMSNRLDKHILPCYLENGYTSQAMARYFEQGAMSFTISDQAQPLSTCFAFRNYEAVWEIGGVYTAAFQRRQGLAKRVVETALHQVLDRGWTPRYQVRETNQPSIRLAEALGLKPFVVTEHFFYDAAST